MKKLNYKRISLLLLLTIICIPLCACKKPETEEPSEQPNEQIQAPTRTPSTDKNEKNEMVYIILDKTGKIVKFWDKVDIDGHVKEVAEFVKTLQ